MASQTHDYAESPAHDANTRSQSRPTHIDLEAQTLPTESHDSSESPVETRQAHVTISDSAIPLHETNDHHTSPSPGLRKTATGFSGHESIEGLKRRVRRSNTARTYQPSDRGTGWQPGQEPGIDTSDPAPPYGGSGDVTDRPAHLHTRCQIMVVDWCEDNMQLYQLDNDTLEAFLNEAKPEWVRCRWINVNGLSWDVIRQLGNHKRLHRLAIEDLMNTRNRTKADFYNDHTFMVLALQKLVNLNPTEDSDSEDDSDNEKPGHKTKRHRNQTRPSSSSTGAIVALLRDIFRPKSTGSKPARIEPGSGANSDLPPLGFSATPPAMRTLQRYHASPNEDRTDFMERHAILASRGLGVAMEQVSIFLSSDNSVTSFFEFSADDIEGPIINRLESPETILRQCCDASMLTQAIIDTIIDLAIPVTRAYQDALGDIELAVLTDPDIHQSTSLYILTTEIAVLRNAVAPISSLINSLKDHKAQPVGPPPGTPGLYDNHRPVFRHSTTATSKPLVSGVTISPLTHTYLGDVDDHIELIAQGYESMRRSADNLVDLIFNTVSAYQNESMKQLTLVTCFFLPLTFLTGYYGMNLRGLNGLQNGDSYFWAIAVPFVLVVIFFLARDMIGRKMVRFAQKRLIKRGRKRREEGRQRLRKNGNVSDAQMNGIPFKSGGLSSTGGQGGSR